MASNRAKEFRKQLQQEQVNDEASFGSESNLSQQERDMEGKERDHGGSKP